MHKNKSEKRLRGKCSTDLAQHTRAVTKTFGEKNSLKFNFHGSQYFVFVVNKNIWFFLLFVPKHDKETSSSQVYVLCTVYISLSIIEYY